MESTTFGETQTHGHLSPTDEARVLGEYRSISVLAIVGLLFGIASPLALAAKLLSGRSAEFSPEPGELRKLDRTRAYRESRRCP